MAVDLSVGIIFKNEIRCLERCLKSLQALKKDLTCEIVMADTGSTDGSRAIAERYADVVFDFPWVDDFAAARNAVLERCKGKWELTLDCDEWLEDTSALENFLHSASADKKGSGAVTVRNYLTDELDRYEEGVIVRLFRMADKPRYEGRIHEAVEFKRPVESALLPELIIHHDGYVFLNNNSEFGKEKIKRNMNLLRKKLREEPDSLLTHLQLIESGKNEEDFLEIIRCAVGAVRSRKKGWERFGPAIFRYALLAVVNDELPVWDEWTKIAFDLFSKSYFIRVDGNFAAQQHAFLNDDYAACVSYAEAYLKARGEYRNDRSGRLAVTAVSALKTDYDYCEAMARINLGSSYLSLEQPERALAALSPMPWSGFDESETDQMLLLLLRIFAKSDLDLSTAMLAFWNGLQQEEPNGETAEKRRQSFLKKGEAICASEEVKLGGKVVDLHGRRPSDLFLPLAGKCALGDRAALSRCENAEDADAALSRCCDLMQLPADALIRALKLGAAFPLPDRALKSEEAVLLAEKLKEDPAFLREAAIFAADAAEDAQDILWASALNQAALEANDWAADPEPMPLICAFVRAQSAFLMLCYTAAARKSPESLPAAHRFALYLANAFHALFPGDTAREFSPAVSLDMRGALAQLRCAVETAPEQKPVVDRILDELSK